MSSVIICLLHGSRTLKDYELELSKRLETEFTDHLVYTCFYSKIFESYLEPKLDDLLLKHQDDQIYVLNVILSSGHNYEQVKTRLTSSNITYTKPLLTYDTSFLDKDILYVAHGPDNVDFINIKNNYQVIYLDEIEQINIKEGLQIRPLFLSRSHHALEVINNKLIKDYVIDEILLERSDVICSLINNLKELVNEN